MLSLLNFEIVIYLVQMYSKKNHAEGRFEALTCLAVRNILCKYFWRKTFYQIYEKSTKHFVKRFTRKYLQSQFPHVTKYLYCISFFVPQNCILVFVQQFQLSAHS